MRFTSLFVVVLVVLAVTATPATADEFAVDDSNFSSGVYELRYYTSTGLLVENGTATSPSASSLFRDNSAYAGIGSDAGVKYLQRVSGGLSVASTMGFDLSAVTGQIATVELLTRQYIFSFYPHGGKSADDKIFAGVATPTAFGAGSYTSLYELTSDGTAATGTVGSGSVMDVTSSLSAAWLANPGLLEFQFGYELADTDIPGRHLQLFRDNSFWTSGALVDDGFMLRITLESTPVPEPTTLALVGLGAGALALRRRRRKLA